MASNVTITPQSRRAVKPLGGNGIKPRHEFVIDEQTYWTGKRYDFALRNEDTYPRYYRVTVTNLKWGDEYVVRAQGEMVTENALIEIAPNARCAFEVILGGKRAVELAGAAVGEEGGGQAVEPRSTQVPLVEPKEPVTFQVKVEDYATRDERSKPRFVLDDTLVWIPLLKDGDVYLETPTPEVRIRAWRRRAEFDVVLVNRSWVPVAAEIRAEPDEESKGAGITGTNAALREPVPNQQEQPVHCVVTMENRIKAPVTIDVDATYEVPDLNLHHVTNTKTVQIVPVKFLKVWYDWLVVIIPALLVFLFLFGIHPITAPGVMVKVVFAGGIPYGAKPEDLKLELASDGVFGAATQIGDGKELAGESAFEYKFAWTPRFSGLRFLRRSEGVSVTVDPGSHADTYSGRFHFKDYTKKEVARIDADAGVTPRSGGEAGIITLGGNRGYSIRVMLSPEPVQQTPITVDFSTADGQPVPGLDHKQYKKGMQVQVPSDSDNLVKTTGEELKVHASDGAGSDWNGVASVVFGTEPTPVTLKKEGVRTAIVVIPVAQPRTPFNYKITDLAKGEQISEGLSKDGSEQRVIVPLPHNKANVEVAVTVTGISWADNAYELTPGSTTLTALPKQPQGAIGDLKGGGDGGKPIDIGKVDAGKDQSAVGGIVQFDRKGGSDQSGVSTAKTIDVSKWADRLNLQQWDNAWSKEAAAPGSLTVTMDVHRIGASGDVKIILTASEDCMCQVYECFADQQVQVWHSKNGDDTWVSSDDSQVFLLSGGKPFDKVRDRLHRDTDSVTYIVLACRVSAYPSKEPNMEAAIKAADKIDGWYIGGTVWKR